MRGRLPLRSPRAFERENWFYYDVGRQPSRRLMQRDEAVTRLKLHEAELKRLGVEHLYLFGSTARGDAREDSDVDLFFDYEEGKFGLLKTDGRERRRRQDPRPQDRHHDAR